MKGHVGDVVKLSEAKSASAASGAEPLFPRLHVRETEKTGPKAPPRNKMALYEQFTVPSYRFIQPRNQASGTIMYQQKQHESHDIRYLPYYRPFVPYGSTNTGIPMCSSPSNTTFSSGITAVSNMVNDEGPKKVARHHYKEFTSRSSKGLTVAGADPVRRGSTGQKRKLAGYSHVPASSSCRIHVTESTSLFQSVPSCAVKSSTGISDDAQEFLSSVEPVVEYKVQDGQPRLNELADSQNACMTDEEQATEVAPQTQSNNNMLGEPNEQLSRLQTEPGCWLPGSNFQVPTAQACAIIGSGFPTNHKGIDYSLQSSKGQAIKDPQTSLWNGASSDAVGGDVAVSMGKALSEREHRKAQERMSENGNRQDRMARNGNSQVSQPSAHCEITIGGDSNDQTVSLLSDTGPNIKPKDVIHVIGQQRFWKARKTLLRQQQMFSDQNFQLHKLIKVQQLLAETPGTLLGEEMHFETIEECDADASGPMKDATLGARTRAFKAACVGGTLVDKERHLETTEECDGAVSNQMKDATPTGARPRAFKAACDAKDGSVGKAPELKSKPRVAFHECGGIQAGGKNDARARQSLHELRPGGVSAWGYPSLGPWVGPMAAQGQPILYPSFTGTSPAASPLGLPYGTALLGSVTPMGSFGIPCSGPRQALATEIGSNHASSIIHKQEGVGAGYNAGHNSSYVISNDLSGPLHSMQQNGFNAQTVYATGPGKDIPKSYGASVNKSSVATSNVKKTRFPVVWGSIGRTERVNTDGLDSSGHHTETSSPLVATNNQSSGVSTPSTSTFMKLHKAVGTHAHALDLASMRKCYNPDSFVPYTNVMERQKHVRDNKDGDGADNGRPWEDDDHSGNSLELFPPVPSSSSSWHRQNVRREMGTGQGRLIRAVPRRAVAASESAAGILLSLQQERQK